MVYVFGEGTQSSWKVKIQARSLDVFFPLDFIPGKQNSGPRLLTITLNYEKKVRIPWKNSTSSSVTQVLIFFSNSFSTMWPSCRLHCTVLKVMCTLLSSRCAHLNWSVVYFLDLLWKLSSLETSEWNELCTEKAELENMLIWNYCWKKMWETKHFSRLKVRIFWHMTLSWRS